MPDLANSSPVPANRVGLTRHRLWFLYQFVGLIKAEVEELTGWTRGEIDSGLDRWDLRQFASRSYWTTNTMLEDIVAERFGIPRTMENMEPLADLRRRVQDQLYDRFRKRGAIDWEAVDAFPEPPPEDDAA